MDWDKSVREVTAYRINDRGIGVSFVEPRDTSDTSTETAWKD